MSKMVKIFISSFICLIILMAIIIGCSDDLIVEPPPSLLGDYDGRYLVTSNFGDVNSQTKVFLITWRFSDQNYWMYDNDPDEEFCLPFGKYTLDVEVTLKEDDRNNGCSGVVGNEEFNPRGVFSLRQPGDSVILTQLEGTTFKEVRLVKTSN